MVGVFDNWTVSNFLDRYSNGGLYQTIIWILDKWKFDIQIPTVIVFAKCVQAMHFQGEQSKSTESTYKRRVLNWLLFIN